MMHQQVVDGDITLKELERIQQKEQPSTVEEECRKR